MLTLRPEQMEAFREAALRRFESEFVVHLRAYAPRHAQALGEVGLRNFIRAGIDRSEAYGFTARGPVQLFLELMMLLGIGFDTDPLLPWAAAAMRHPALPDQMAKAGILYDGAIAYLNAVAGEENAYVYSAMNRALSPHLNPLSSVQMELRVDICKQLCLVYPEKCRYVGREAMMRMIELGIDRAKRYDITEPSGIGMYCALMFAFGHRFDEDPRIPEVSTILQRPEGGRRQANIRALYTWMLDYFETTRTLRDAR